MTGGISEKDKYRPIVLASVSPKLLETIILKRCKENLTTTDHQFGFKPAHGTDMAIYTVKKIYEYYLKNKSAVHVCSLETSKVFDR